jgi:tetratricopeptide (TPR) repeat protein
MTPPELTEEFHRPHAQRLARLAAVMAAVLASACQAPPTATTPAPAPAKPVAAPEPAPPPPVAVPAPPPAPEPANPANAQRLVSSAIELLEAGNEEHATIDLQRALQADPNPRLAQSLMRQLTADPMATLGRESFAYRVQPGESLSRIAQRFLGDVHLFYLLARYNDIKVPKQLAGGQLIKIPGRAQPPAPGPAATVPAPATPPQATPTATPPRTNPADVARAEREKADRERNQAIARATRAARSAFARQDLDNAIKQWDLVLELDPSNATARLERQRAVELKERLGKVK